MPSPSTQEEHIPFLLVDDNAINLKVCASRRARHARPLPLLSPARKREREYTDAHCPYPKMLGSYMKKLGRGYDCASNGLEALEGCRARTVNNYRCIFMG